QGDVEFGMEREALHRLCRGSRAAGGIPERGQVLLCAELVDVRASAPPRATSHENRAIVRCAKGNILVSGDADEGAVRLAPTLERSLIGPELRGDGVNVVET